MKFVENLKKAAENTFNVVAKKTGEIVSDSKVKYSIFDLKNEIEKHCKELGYEVYAGYKEDRNVSEYIEEKCRAIDSLNEKINELKNELEK